MHEADLGGGEADAERVGHELAHLGDLLGELVVEAVDLPGAGAQHRIAELAHVGERLVAPGAGLGIELGRLVGLDLELGVVRDRQLRIGVGVGGVLGHRWSVAV